MHKKVAPMPNASPVTPSRHYAALDGLRGMAAIMVVLFHIGNGLHMFFIAANAGLAVDFFFCLSGFVLDLSYRRRLDEGMGTLKFMELRLTRLMPLVVLATLVSAAYVGLRTAAGVHGMAAGTLIVATVLALLNLPSTKSIGGQQVFPLNGPQYSLFLEIVANFLWACSPRLRRTDATIAVMILAAAGLVWLGFGGDQDSTFLAGFPRVLLSFLFGTLIHRFGSSLPAPKGWLPFALACAGMFAMILYPRHLGFWPHFAFVVLLSPALVHLGARLTLSPRAQDVASALGRLSYPLYILHFPIFMWVNGVSQIALHGRHVLVIAPIALVIACLFAVLAERLFDEPVRRALGRLRARGTGVAAA